MKTQINTKFGIENDFRAGMVTWKVYVITTYKIKVPWYSCCSNANKTTQTKEFIRTQTFQARDTTAIQNAIKEIQNNYDETTDRKQETILLLSTLLAFDNSIIDRMYLDGNIYWDGTNFIKYE